MLSKIFKLILLFANEIEDLYLIICELSFKHMLAKRGNLVQAIEVLFVS